METTDISLPVASDDDLTTDQVARECGVRPTTVAEWRQRGVGPQARLAVFPDRRAPGPVGYAYDKREVAQFAARYQPKKGKPIR